MNNDLYNDSPGKAEEFKFPHENESFDIILSFSLFTHMPVREIQNYLVEMARTLTASGTGFSTFFLYDDKSEKAISRNGSFGFPIKKSGFRLMSDKTKSGNVALHKDYLQKMAQNAGLKIMTIKDGFWKETENTIEYQDIVTFKKI